MNKKFFYKYRYKNLYFLYDHKIHLSYYFEGFLLMDEVAIFWDYENVRVVPKGINVPIAEALITYSESLGHPRVKRVYSNWAGINKEIIQALYSLGFDAIQVSMGKPNSVDVKIAVDCLETAQLYPDINCFILLTGDKDFISLVNALKAKRIKVIIIGDSHTVSEHLLLSADDFLSLEELSKMYIARDFSKIMTPKKKENPTPFSTAVELLIETVKLARESSKTTRRGVIDNLMRSATSFDYKGATMVQRPDDATKTFNSFSKFIVAAEDKGKIKTEISEGFMEIFLPEEDPQIESELSPNLKDVIDKEDWRKIIEIVIKALIESKNNDIDGLFFTQLNKSLKPAKKQGLLAYSNRNLQYSIAKLIDIGFLVPQSDSKFGLATDFKENCEKYLKKAMNSMDDLL